MAKERKRYNLVLPTEVYEKVKQIAEEEDTSVLELMKKFIKLGLLAVEVEKDEDSELILRGKEGDKKLMTMFTSGGGYGDRNNT